MTNSDLSTPNRRRFLKLVGGGAVVLPLAALTACSGDKPAATDTAPKPAADAAPKPAPAKEAATETANTAAADAAPAQGDMPRLSEDDPQAKTLGYVHDTTTVDAAKYPRHQSGQACSNCALYQGAAGSEWGGCSIFPGKAVKATGWCNVYAPKA